MRKQGGAGAWRPRSMSMVLTRAHAALRMSFSLTFSTPVARLLHHSSGAGLFQHARRCAVMQREVQPWHSRRRVHSTCAAAEC